MDPLNIHHVIRHRLSRIETSNFQDKSGCSINGIRSFLFEEGIVQDLDGMDDLVNNYGTIQDYRGYPIQLSIEGQRNFQLSDEILKMKNVQFFFGNQSRPIHKLVSPEPHFVEEERNLIENHFSCLGKGYYIKLDDIEEWDCLQMDCEGHLVSIVTSLRSKFQLSNESIEHLSNFPYLRNLHLTLYSSTHCKYEDFTNLSLLSNLVNLSTSVQDDSELFQDLGLFSNLISLGLYGKMYSSGTCIIEKYHIIHFNSVSIRTFWAFKFIQFGVTFFGRLHSSRFVV